MVMPMSSTPSGNAIDPFDLSRFVTAQENVYAHALAEIRAGRKRTHWMWYIFPQIDGLAVSSTSKFYAMKSLDEARAYLDHPVLGPRLRECAQALLDVNGPTAHQIFGAPDDIKLRSCVTLFAIVSPPGSVFDQVLQKYFAGEPDPRTVQLRATT